MKTKTLQKYYAKKIKDKLVSMAMNNTLPMDMTTLDSTIFEKIIQPLCDTLETIYEDANMALDDSWDRGDDGFQVQQDLIDGLLSQ